MIIDIASIIERKQAFKYNATPTSTSSSTANKNVTSVSLVVLVMAVVAFVEAVHVVSTIDTSSTSPSSVLKMIHMIKAKWQQLSSLSQTNPMIQLLESLLVPMILCMLMQKIWICLTLINKSDSAS